MEITRADIDRVAQIMNKDFSDAERTDVIQCLDCCDVNACPGSGKTTTMVAKLLILSEKIAGTKSGICALSHTNAAKNEINQSFGPHSGALMSYPHFVGTIQAFIDSFLAIPAYIEEFGRRPSVIDDDLFTFAAKRSYMSVQRFVRDALDKHTNGKGQELLCNTSYGFTNFNLVTYLNNREDTFYCQSTTPTYRGVLRWKNELTSAGYLTYHDAFSYANRYLQKYPYLSTIISNRFSYLFIDEMQDTDSFQNDLLEQIFRNHSIIQKFGDPNQAIYGQRSQGGISVWTPERNHSIRTSRRLSTSISRISQGICSEPNEIVGNALIPNLPHTVLLFNQSRKRDVIPKFGQIIQDLHLQEGPYKALGAVGRPNSNPNYLSITSYWPSFQRKLQQNCSNNSFWGLIRQAQSSINITKSYSEASKLLTRAFTELLHVQQIRAGNGRPYNSSLFLRTIRDKGVGNFNHYQSILLSTCERLYAVGDLEINEILSQARIVFSYLGALPDERSEAIIRNRDGDIQPNNPMSTLEPNMYFHSPEIPIEINTIHAAKGQTHQATLVLETYYYQSDLVTILPYLYGRNNRNPGIRVLNRFLPLTYVSCTRPSHLLCLAIQMDHINAEQQNRLLEYGWRIDESLTNV